MEEGGSQKDTFVRYPSLAYTGFPCKLLDWKGLQFKTVPNCQQDGFEDKGEKKKLNRWLVVYYNWESGSAVWERRRGRCSFEKWSLQMK